MVYSDETIKKLVEEYIIKEHEETKNKIVKVINSDDFVNVLEFTVKINNCSAAKIQNEFDLDYADAACYIDAMEALNLIEIIKDEKNFQRIVLVDVDENGRMVLKYEPVQIATTKSISSNY